MKKLYKYLALLSSFILFFNLTACGNQQPDKENNSTNSATAGKLTEDIVTAAEDSFTEEVTLLIDFHGWNPTINDTPTPENPNVFNSPARIAEAFMKLYPNVKIEWARTKPIGSEEEAAQWFTTQLNANTAPAIIYTWGTKFQSRGWYLDLDEYLDQPNPFIEGNEKWRDIFPEYLWKNTNVLGGNQKVLALPVTLYPGPATGYYYNKEAFLKAGITQCPATYEELVEDVNKLKALGYHGIAPHPYFKNNDLDQWIFGFITAPSVCNYIMDKADYDRNGSVDSAELARGVLEGIYNPSQHDYARELYDQIKRYYTEVLEPGWESIDYEDLWNKGEVAFYEDGLWRLTSENNNTARKFDYGIFPEVMMTRDTTEFSSEISYTENGPYQPDPDLSLNIMKDTVKDNPAMLKAAILFLQFLTTPENVTMLVQENGSTIGAVKGSEPPAQLSEWLNQPFPIVPKATWPKGFTGEYDSSVNKTFESWVKNELDDETFYREINELQVKGAKDYIKSMQIDTEGWTMNQQ